MLNENIKGVKQLLENLDKCSILLYKMSNNITYLQNYYDIVFVSLKNNVNMVNLTKIKDSPKTVLLEEY